MITKKDKAQTVPTPEIEEEDERLALGIESDVPIPSTRGVTASSKYPFEKMQPGDSFPIRRPLGTVNISNIKAQAERAVPHAEWTTRKIEDGLFRIWRKS